MNVPDITIIGLGRFGQAFAKKLNEKDLTLKSVFNRTEEPVHRLARQLKISESGTFPSQKQQLGHLVFLTLSDGVIEDIAHRLAALDRDFSGYTFVHCSGNEPAELLVPLQKKGAAIASFHPLQTFTGRSEPQDFENIFFSLQGDKQSFRMLMPLAKKLDAHAFEVTAEQKSQLHAAAVMASNYLVSLMNVSADTGGMGGLPQKQVQKALLPLVQKTLQNISRQPLDKALTGPIARGDIQTVKQHLALLNHRSNLREVYAVLGKEAVRLARQSENINQEEAEKLLELLDS